ncbi:hypothetical protein PGIGA_G00106510 [Pangasianodon gigas]|uniref:Uncharacterized protein n=1 Tax=Pangasianodon gigas TaxID=30993 RepID=A0ACC5W819_PANGG|nr:hypothetical protein [Pangasianodon gigas]
MPYLFLNKENKYFSYDHLGFLKTGHYNHFYLRRPYYLYMYTDTNDHKATFTFGWQ